MSKGSILYIGGFELPDKNAAAHRVVNNAKIFRDLGYDVVFIDTNRSRNLPIERTETEHFGFKTYSMSNTKNRQIKIDDFKRVHEAREEKPFMVIAYNYPAIALWKLYRFCRKHQILLISDCTEWYAATDKNIIRKVYKGFDSFARMHILHPKLDGIIVISKYLEEFYKEKTKTICIPPLTDLSDVKWKIEEKASENELIHILYAGSPGYHKDKLNRILEAMKSIKCSNIRFTILGITKEQFLEYYPEDEDIVGQLEESVIFMGRVPHDEVVEYLKASDYSLFYREITRVTMAGFPTKFAESITRGVPVITNATSDLSDYIRNNKNGLLLSTDNFVEELPELLTRISNHELVKPTVEREI